MHCHGRPVLVGEPHGPWSGKTFSDSYFPNLSYDINGELYPINKRIMPSNWQSIRHIRTAKKRLQKAGYANQNDANYFAMKILDCYPMVAKAIIHRFPFFIIDEAQDTSEIQMKIIDLLINNGLENIMLLGDPDQAIFEWHTANPKLFIEKYNEWKDNSIILNENRRSSQNICNCSFKLSTLQETSKAINEEVKECTFVPEVKTYDIDNIGELIEYFKGLCSVYDIDVTPEKVAVIFRSKNIFNVIAGIAETGYEKQPWVINFPYSKDFAKGKYLICNGDFRKGFCLIQNAIIKVMTGKHFCSAQDLKYFTEMNGIVEFRKNVYKIIKLLPDINHTIGEWIEKANALFIKNQIDIKLNIKRSLKDISFDELFGNENKRITECQFRVGTIHSVKGETFEAVLVILKQKGIGKHYKTLLRENVQISDNEELRIVYVGITRPRRLLVLAVPDDENKAAWETRLFDK